MGEAGFRRSDALKKWLAPRPGIIAAGPILFGFLPGTYYNHPLTGIVHYILGDAKPRGPTKVVRNCVGAVLSALLFPAILLDGPPVLR